MKKLGVILRTVVFVAFAYVLFSYFTGNNNVNETTTDKFDRLLNWIMSHSIYIAVLLMLVGLGSIIFGIIRRKKLDLVNGIVYLIAAILFFAGR